MPSEALTRTIDISRNALFSFASTAFNQSQILKQQRRTLLAYTGSSCSALLWLCWGNLKLAWTSHCCLWYSQTRKMLAAHITGHLQNTTMLLEPWRLFEEGWRNRENKKIFKKTHKTLVVANCSGEMCAVLWDDLVLFIRYLHIDIFMHSLSLAAQRKIKCLFNSEARQPWFY